MKKILYIALFLLTISCSKTKKLHDRLIGTWNIESIQGEVIDTIGITPFEGTNVGYFLFREITTLANQRDGEYHILVKNKTTGFPLVVDDEKPVGWDNDGTSVTTNNYDEKKIIWTVLSNGKTSQEWAGSYNSGPSRHINITKMVLKKQ